MRCNPVPRFISILIFAVVALTLLGQDSAAQQQPLKEDQGQRLNVPRKVIPLSTSKQIYLPAPGLPRTINSMPVTLAISPDGRYAVTMNAGYGTAESGFRQSLSVLDLETNQLSDFPDNRFGPDSQQSYFLGLAFSPDGKHIFASVGSVTDPLGKVRVEKNHRVKEREDTGNGIAVYSFDMGKIIPERFLKIPLQPIASGKIAAPINNHTPPGVQIPYPAGMAFIGPSGDRLLVAQNLSDDAVVLDTRTGKSLQRFDLSIDEVVPGSYPYAVVVTRDGKRAYVSLWNASRVAELDLEKGSVIRMISLEEPLRPTMAGSHPTALLLTPDESRLYVALANFDEVAVVNTADGRFRGRISMRLPGQNYLGATPNSLAEDAQGTRLYVADAGVNSIAVVNISGIPQTPRLGLGSYNIPVMGFIPTEWYPTAVAVRGNDLLIATGKALGPGPNSQTIPVNAHGQKDKHPYIFELLHGSIARLNRSDAEKDLGVLTQEAMNDNFIERRAQMPSFPEGKSPIHHVIYIIKENRTYDQVLGDLKEANGDPSLVMFGEDITPNQHRIAREFGILDNFYASGEVSGDGHNWSTAGVASDYLEKTVQINYRNSQRTYDYEGKVANRIPLDDGMPDVNEAGAGYIWTDVAHHSLSYRHYGEFISTTWCDPLAAKLIPNRTLALEQTLCARPEIKEGDALPPNLGDPHGSKSPWPWPIPMIARNTATKRELRNHFDPQYADFNTAYPDQLRVDEFLNEFKDFVQARNTGHGQQLPNYVLLRLPNDHTTGTHPERATPAAAVADNDLAVGRVVEAVSNSAYWNDTAILIVEDDAQDGPDHVDAHRTTAYVVSKYSPSSVEKPYVEHGFYTTVGLIRTLEVLLGLPPMNVNDAHSPWIASLFSGPGDHSAFHADYRNRDNGLIYQMNPANGPDARASAALDFSEADRADNVKLNAILWRNRMGNRPMPAPRHTVFAEGTEPSGADKE